MEAKIRKIVTVIEDVLIEGGKAVPRPYRAIVAAAVIANPWAGAKFVEDLRPGINAIAPVLGDALVPKLLAHVSPDAVEAYGKAAVVGTSGEIEHASAMIHTLRFGNKLREVASGVSFLPFTNKRAAPGCAVDVPMKHKNDRRIAIVLPDDLLHDSRRTRARRNPCRPRGGHKRAPTRAHRRPL